MAIPKKIIFVITSLRIGGTERRFLSLIYSLQSNKQFEITVLLLDKNIELHDFIDLKVKYRIIDKNSYSLLALLKKYNKLIHRIKPDIVHVWDSFSASCTAIIKLFNSFIFINGQIASAPIKLPMFSKIRLYSSLNFFFSDIIISNTEYGLTAYHAPLKKSICIHNGFDLGRLQNNISCNEIRKLYSITSKYIIAMIANFTEYKDQKTLLIAAKRILKKRMDVDFIFVGDGPMLNQCRDLIETEIESTHIKFLGKIRNVDLLVKCIDIGVLTTYTEGISNTLMEYMAFGKPVITTENPGTFELVKNLESGYLLEANNHEILTEKILLLLSDKHIRERMGSVGKAIIIENFNLNKMINKYIQVYEKVTY